MFDDKSKIRDTRFFYAMELLMLTKEMESRKDAFYYNYEPAGDKQIEFHNTVIRFRELHGGLRSSKTMTATYDMMMLLLGDHPKQKEYGMPVPSNWWYVVSSFKKITQVGGIWDEVINKMLPGNTVANIANNGRDSFRVDFKNGSKLEIISQEQGVGAFRSAKINGFIADEKIANQNIMRNLRMRIFDTDGIGIFTRDSFEDDEYMEMLVLNGEAKAWRLTVDDNKYLSEEGKEAARREMDKIDQMVLLDGIHQKRDEVFCFKDIWNEKNYFEIEPVRFDVDVTGNKLVVSETGLLRMFKKPDDKMKYVLSIDPGEGGGGDETVVNIFSRDGEQVAVWHSNKIKPAKVANIVAFLSRYYNDCETVCENKGSSGGIVIDNLKRLRVKQYSEYSIDTKGKPHLKGVGVKTSPGASDTSKNKMIEELLDDMIAGDIRLHYWITKEQFDRFIKKEIGEHGKYTYKEKKKLRWSGDRGTGENEQDGMIIGGDDHCMSTVLADFLLRKRGYVGERSQTVNDQRMLAEKMIEDDDSEPIPVLFRGGKAQVLGRKNNSFATY